MQRDPLEKLLTRSRKAMQNQVDDSHALIQQGILRKDRAFPSWPDTTPRCAQEVLTEVANWSVQISATLFASTLDHLYSLDRLILAGIDSRDSLHVWSYLTLSRVVVEAATTFCELNDPDVANEIRVGRASAIIFAGRIAELRHAEAIDKSLSDAERVRESLREFREKLIHAGFKIKTNRRGKEIALLRNGEEYPLDSRTTSKSKKWLVNSVAPYENGSAVTHSSWWFLLSSFSVQPEKMIPAFDPNILAISVSCCLDSLFAMSRTVAPDEMTERVEYLEKKTNQRIEIVIHAGRNCD